MDNGEISTMEAREFSAYMEGYARASHSLSGEHFFREGLRYAEERGDMDRRSFGEVMNLINTTVKQIMEGYA